MTDIIAVLISSPFLFMGVIPLIIGLLSYKKGKKYASESKVMVSIIVNVVKGVKISIS
ncbi:hypothetical protein rsdtw13_26480 [Clostridium sp. TW13]|uniref:Uncharacterized protein n=1 Tax=Inconstantimicrobium mannanitabidum TaxID=1604901 RepID=A0ACB5RE29_9CLOT|nr:hypothetical protein rsdtw13_26480 [Clostridium sp. TW13]